MRVLDRLPFLPILLRALFVGHRSLPSGQQQQIGKPLNPRHVACFKLRPVSARERFEPCRESFSVKVASG